VYPNGFEALRTVSMGVGEGEIVALIGRSGAGKSTLPRCLNGMQRPTSGQVMLDDVDACRLDELSLRRRRRQIDFIWQEYNLVGRLTAAQNVITGRLGYHDGLSSLLFHFDRGHREIAIRSLERVQMLHQAEQRADRLSGGEKPRVAIARPLAQQRRVILAAEPVASLDVELVAVVTGEVGARIQAWRERYDPVQARRLPPHTTLCYRAPTAEHDLLERQVRHAFDRPITARLGSVHEFDNREHTLYLEVRDTAALDEARSRLYEGTHLELLGRPDWTWHVTCVRNSRSRPDLEALRRAATELDLDAAWPIDTIAYLELRGDRYEALATWQV